MNGNLGAQQAHYFEGETVPYRLRFDGISAGGVEHTVRIEFDTSVLQSGAVHHALDYLRSFNASETDANPCAGVAGCAPGSFSTLSIPLDSHVAAGPDRVGGTADDLTQLPGSFTLFGGTLKEASAYTVAGSYAGSSQTSVTLTFTATVANPVLAWGGHISTRANWKPDQTAVDIPGSPYHMRLLDIDDTGGNQDRSLSAAAVHTPPEIIVIKHVINDQGGTAVAADFQLSVTGTSPVPSSFSGEESPGTLVVLQAGPYNVTETNPGGYQVSYSAECSGTAEVDKTVTCTVTNDDQNLCWNVNCAAPASECLEAGVCDPGTGQCTYAPKAEGTSCTDDGNACTTDACNASGACVHPAGNAGATCRGSAGYCDVPEVCSGTSDVCPADAKSTAQCRASAGLCDSAEFCDGQGDACPGDAFLPSSTTCRSSAGVCDVAETCTGASAACPGDAFLPSSTTCRGSEGVCDVAETCTGASAACPGDAFLPSSTTCRASEGVCDVAEACTGTGAFCPDDSKSTGQCRASAGSCDVAEVCDGVGNACPADGFKDSSVTCRGSEGVCDVAETCTGSGASCPGDLKSTAQCRASGGVCDVAEVCDGIANECPADGFAAATTQCRASNGVCDVAETCSGASAACPDDGFSQVTLECRPAAGLCDVGELCSGASASCPDDTFAPPATECRASGGSCDVAEACTGTAAACPDDAFEPQTTVCRSSAGVCDVEETCSGSSSECPGDSYVQATQVCRGAEGTCDSPEICSGDSAFCPADQKSTDLCRGSAGSCDVPEFCDGAGDHCPADGFLQASLVCRDAAGVCDLPDSCDGASAFCPADLKSTAVCRASAGVCDVAESCDGVANFCPGDVVASAGTVCRPGTSSCDPAETCSGASGACPADVVAGCSLCGEKYYDANASGGFDPAEKTLAGWQVTVTSALASLTTTTDAFGRYTFAGLPEGDYTVCESVPTEANWLQNEPVQGCYTAHLPSADAQACSFDFGNACLGEGGGHTIGFWGNQNGQRKFLGLDNGAMALTVLTALNLATEDGSAFDPVTYAEFAAWLRDVRAVNMAYMLSAQLAATSMNVLRGFVDGDAKIYAPGTQSADSFGFAAVKDVAREANTELGLHPLTTAGSPDRAYQEKLKQALDKANNNLNFLQAEPCAFSFPPPPVAVP